MLKKFINFVVIQASEIAYWRLSPAKAFLNVLKLISLLATTILFFLIAVAVITEPSKAAELPPETWLLLFGIVPFFTWLLIARVDTIPKLFRFYVCVYATYGLAGMVLKVMADPWYVSREPMSPLVIVGFFLAAWWLPLTRHDPHYIEIWKRRRKP